MNIVWGFFAIAGACAVGVTALLSVRRRAPEGGFFGDGDRAAGVFGVLATGFSILPRTAPEQTAWPRSLRTAGAHDTAWRPLALARSCGLGDATRGDAA
jgi:hypothetical protein